MIYATKIQNCCQKNACSFRLLYSVYIARLLQRNNTQARCAGCFRDLARSSLVETDYRRCNHQTKQKQIQEPCKTGVNVVAANFHILQWHSVATTKKSSINHLLTRKMAAFTAEKPTQSPIAPPRHHLYNDYREELNQSTNNVT
jgi:hypothetical protein